MQGFNMLGATYDSLIPSQGDRTFLASIAKTDASQALHVINGEHYSGAERVQDLLALNLGKLGFEVSFACLKAGKFDHDRTCQSAPLRTMKMRSRFDLRPVNEIARWLRKEKFSIIHTHTPRSAMIGRLASLMARIPHVHHIHSPTGRDSTRKVQDSLNARLEQFSLYGTSAVIAVSKSLAGYAADLGIPRRRIHVVPNGVPTMGILNRKSPPKNAWTIGVMALFRPRKGLEVLLESLSQLRKAGHNIRLRAVGEFETSEYRRQIETQVERLRLVPLIDWVGFTRDVPHELSQLDLFVLPSLFGEGLPMVLLEAMAAGVPVVATRVEGVPEALRDGIDGVIAAPNDPADLTRSILRFVQGEIDWSAVRASAHRRQSECFSDISMANGVADVYREVLA